LILNILLLKKNDSLLKKNMNKKRTINNIIQNKNSFKKISIYSRKKFINDVMTKIKKLSLLILLIIIINIKATRIFSPHLKT
jgi:hypothetical protein